MNLPKDKLKLLWEWYMELGDKDAVHTRSVDTAEEVSEIIPRALIRKVLSQDPPEGIVPHEPRILFVDIETAPHETWIFNQWAKFIPHDAVTSDWYILSYAWSWGRDGEVSVDHLGNYSDWDEGEFDKDEPLLMGLWQLMDEADIVVAHNGNRFDIPKINTRFLAHKMPPPSPYQSVDTLAVFKKKFKMRSNALLQIAKDLGLTLKLESGGMPRWIAAVKGSSEAMQQIADYNIGDIDTLREAYYRILAWIPSHPNFGVISQQAHVCPNCGSKSLTAEQSPYRTPAGAYAAWRCDDCGAQARERRTTISKEVRDGLLVPLAR